MSWLTDIAGSNLVFNLPVKSDVSTQVEATDDNLNYTLKDLVDSEHYSLLSPGINEPISSDFETFKKGVADLPTIEISQSTGEVTVNTPKVEAAKKNYTGPILAMLGIGLVLLKDK